jgi:hypothetical protein
MAMRWGILLCLLALLAGCAGAREVVLVEAINDQIDRTRIGLHHIEPRMIFRQGRRVSVDFASLLVLDVPTNTIKTELVSAGEEVFIDGKRWTVVRVEPHTPTSPGRVVLSDE